MKAAWVLPHPTLPWPDGHQTRAEIACRALPGLHLVDSPTLLDIIPWELAVFDTWGESRCAMAADKLQAEGVPIVSIARALNQPSILPEPAWDLELQPGPYEATRGTVIGPLVDVVPAEVTTDVLVVVSSRRPLPHPWWEQVVSELRAASIDFTVLSVLPETAPNVTGRGVDWIGRANVVIGGAGAAGLYEALWAGKPLVARAFSLEQHDRLTNAIRAGEAVVSAKDLPITEALARARAMAPLGVRPNGAAELAQLLGALA